MTMTTKKRLFAEAKREGKTNTEAAVAAGYSIETAAQAGSRLAKDKDVIGAIERKTTIEVAKEVAKEKGIELKCLILARCTKTLKTF